MPSSSSNGKILASGLRLMREYSICRSTMGWTAAAARADGFGSELAQADVTHVAGLDHVGDGSDSVFNGDVGVEAGGAVDVDVVDAEALEGVREGGFDGGGARVEAEKGAIGAALRSEFDRDEDLVADETESTANEHLIVAHVVEVAGVNQVDAGVDGGMDGGDAFGFVGGAVDTAHAHAAEGDGEDAGAGCAEFAGGLGGGGCHERFSP
jgi:hypothetical protein